ncbi:MAG: aminomethyltransferase [Saprospiraceae bacterium]|jgi:aminomethyltransferase
MKRLQSELASRHRALGSNLEDWIGVGTAWTYSSDARDEHDAIRERAGLFDVSGLMKAWVTGPDAQAVVDHIFTRDMKKVKPGKSAYGLVLTEEGTITDDAIIACFDTERYLVAHGSGHALEMLNESAKGLNATVEQTDAIQDVSLQGPKALEILAPHTPLDLAGLKFFSQAETTLFGIDVIISRTGYSGERGYEVYSKREDICEIWDKILEAGSDAGVMPCSFACLDKIRIESALLFYPYDMNESITPWEVDLGFAVSKTKGDFRGKEALLASEGKENVKLVGLVVDHTDLVGEGDELHIDGKRVGTLNSTIWSHRMGKSLALGHLPVGQNAVGTKVDVRGDVNCTATITSISFYDPEKLKMRG